MAAIQNDRDVLLQAAPVRVVPTVSEVASVRIVASGNTFIQDTELTPTTAPATITLTAELTNLTGTVTWAVISGTATLSYTGNTCTVNGASAALGTLIVKASITDDDKTYTDQAIITKIKDLESQMGREINSVLNNTGDLAIRASETTVRGSSPTTITLTAVKGGGLTGTVTWSRFAGTGDFTPATGDSTTITTSTMSAGSAATFKATLVQGGRTHEAYVTISKLGLLSSADQINLSNQVTGSLSAGNVSGLGALAHLNSVNLSTQTTGTLNGYTQVTNLGNLAYANSIAANQIGAGTLAAGVIYAGTINADNITSGTLTGRSVRTAVSGTRVELTGSDHDYHSFRYYSGSTLNAAIGAVGLGIPHFFRASTIAGMAAVSGTNTSSGVGVLGSSANNNSAGVHASPFLGADVLSTLPSSAPNGSIAMHPTHGPVFRVNGQWWKTNLVGI